MGDGWMEGERERERDTDRFTQQVPRRLLTQGGEKMEKSILFTPRRDINSNFRIM